MGWRPKSPASALFAQLLIHTLIKETIKAPRHWLLCRVKFPAQKASNAEMFPFDAVIMGSYEAEGKQLSSPIPLNAYYNATAV